MAVRGWNPYNRNLLLDPTVRATILKEQLDQEIESGLFPTIKSTHDLHQNENQTISTNQIHHLHSSSLTEVRGLNFSQGLGHYVATTIMTETDRQEARATA